MSFTGREREILEREGEVERPSEKLKENWTERELNSGKQNRRGSVTLLDHQRAERGRKEKPRDCPLFP